ncbi:MAG: hypothetical protein ACP5QX_05830 [Caldisericaceae bacterium]
MDKFEVKLRICCKSTTQKETSANEISKFAGSDFRDFVTLKKYLEYIE